MKWLVPCVLYFGSPIIAFVTHTKFPSLKILDTSLGAFHSHPLWAHQVIPVSTYSDLIAVRFIAFTGQLDHFLTSVLTKPKVRHSKLNKDEKQTNKQTNKQTLCA